MRGYLKGILALVSLGSLVSGGWLMAQNAPVKNVVLVHGAFADGSSWSKVIPLLQAKGLHVTSVGTPLTSFADDLAATKRAIAAEDGPVILVGHSYGGVVITEAGNDPKVAGLVYVAAFAPDANQNITEISKPFPPPPGLSKVKPLTDGFILLTPEGIETAFAQDLTKEEKALLVAVQRFVQLGQAVIAEFQIARPVGLVERPAGRRDRACHVLDRPVGGPPGHLLTGRMDDIECRSAACVLQFTVDEHSLVTGEHARFRLKSRHGTQLYKLARECHPFCLIPAAWRRGCGTWSGAR